MLETERTDKLLKILDRLTQPDEIQRAEESPQKEKSELSIKAHRTIPLNGLVDQDIISEASAHLRALLEEDSDSPIWLSINTTGGDLKLAQGFCVFLKHLDPPDFTTLMCCSDVDEIAKLLFACGKTRITHEDATFLEDGQKSLGFISPPVTVAQEEETSPPPLLPASPAMDAAQAVNKGVATDLL